MSDDVDLDAAPGEWLVSSIGSGVRLLSGKRFICGPAWPVYLIQVEINNCTEKFVLRQFSNKKWLDREPDLAHHEASVLEHAKEIPVPTPRLIAHCADDSVCGHPVLLMSYLDGRVELKPDDLANWLGRLAEALAATHHATVPDLPWRYSSSTDVEELKVPRWSRYGDLWQKAIDVWRAGPPAHEETFIHADFHPVNVLWSSAAIAGVVDWHKGCLGPPCVDVSHCCINLVSLYGLHAAVGFQEAYADVVGGFVHDPFWDLDILLDHANRELGFYPPWLDHGIQRPKQQVLHDRYDEYLLSVMNRV